MTDTIMTILIAAAITVMVALLMWGIAGWINKLFKKSKTKTR
jgi:hypothetical protein